jgi:hypothetical protein
MSWAASSSGVFEDGSQANPLMGVQTVNVPVGGGSIFEVRLREPGDYPFVTHAFADATKGAVGVLRAIGAGEPAAAGGGGALMACETGSGRRHILQVV